MNPYGDFVSEYAALLQKGKNLPMGGPSSQPQAQPKPGPEAPAVLIFSPHPDDECIIGGLALRLLREARMRIINVAVTQGSRKDRQAERFGELQNACRFMGFELIQTAPNGLERVNPKTRELDPAFWKKSVQVISEILARVKPHTIFFPHDADWNSTHIGTHWLAIDALTALGNGIECFVIETEFWGAMTSPNLMVESSPSDVADMVNGTSFHIGEVRRNPFHLFLPAWMQDNVRRGSELVGGQGEAAPDWTFATLYRLRRWREGRLEKVFEGGRQLSAKDAVTSLFR